MIEEDKLVSRRRVVSLFTIMMLLPVLHFPLALGSLGLTIPYFPAGLGGVLKYFYEPLFDDAGLIAVIFGWIIYLILLSVGLRNRSKSAHRKWIILCIAIFLLTWGGCNTIMPELAPKF